MDEIRSAANDRVKTIARLQRDAGFRRRVGLTVLEGRREVERALENGWLPTEVYVSPDLGGDGVAEAHCLAERLGVPVVVVAVEPFRKMSYREGPDGVLAVGPAPGRRLDDLRTLPTSLFLVAERVEKPGNLGALLRTADGAGADGVILCDPAADLGNPNVLRASLGTAFFLPLATATTAETAAWLRSRGVRLVVTSPEARSSYVDVDLKGSVAIAVGAEDAGLSSDLLAAGDVVVRIPMLGRNDSLNVSAAAAVLLYEAVRQRSGGKMKESGPHA
ncbi:MAG: RNA methyltransferase [Candidatus Bipolaricaulota bacterium]